MQPLSLTFTLITCLLTFLVLFSIYHQTNPTSLINDEDVNFDVELKEMPQEIFEFSLAAVSAAYEIFDSNVKDIVKFVGNELKEEYNDFEWFVIANSNRSSFNLRGHCYLLFNVKFKSNVDHFLIGNLLGCTK
nr:uncharacterized protein LOC111428404 [Onthophagus taurus]